MFCAKHSDVTSVFKKQLPQTHKAGLFIAVKKPFSDRCQYCGGEIDRLVFFEPTDRRKAAKPLKFKQNISYSSPNLNELRAMANFLVPNVSIQKTYDMNEVLQLTKIVSKAVTFIIVTLGDKGILTVKSPRDSLVARLYPVKAIKNVENVSGAGDCFISGFISGMLSNYKESNNVSIGIQSAKYALLCKNAVPVDLSMDKISIDEAGYETIKNIDDSYS